MNPCNLKDIINLEFFLLTEETCIPISVNQIWTEQNYLIKAYKYPNNMLTFKNTELNFNTETLLSKDNLSASETLSILKEFKNVLFVTTISLQNCKIALS